MLSRRAMTNVVVPAIAAIGAFVANVSLGTGSAEQPGQRSTLAEGYGVSLVHFELNASDPSLIDMVTFTLDVAMTKDSTIRVNLGGAAWYGCSAKAQAVTCRTVSPPASIDLVAQLRVEASQR